MNNDKSTQRTIELLEGVNHYQHQILDQTRTINRLLTCIILLAVVVILTL